MDARIPKPFYRLPPKEKKAINEAMTDLVIKQVTKEQAELQKIWLKMACIVLHRGFGFGKKRCLLFLANWREIYRENSKIDGSDEQSAFLDKEINKIFGVGGYPKEYIDKLEDI